MEMREAVAEMRPGNVPDPAVEALIVARNPALIVRYQGRPVAVVSVFALPEQTTLSMVFVTLNVRAGPALL